MQNQFKIAVIRKPVALHVFDVSLSPLISTSAQASEKTEVG